MKSDCECNHAPNSWNGFPSTESNNCQVKPYPTQQSFKPYPTQQYSKPYPTQGQVWSVGGVCTQPGQLQLPSKPQQLSFNDAVGSQSVQALQEYLANLPDAVNEKGFNGQLPLHRACLRGDLSVVRLLLRHGANPNDPNDFKETPLHFACKRGNPVLLREMIEHGADVRAEDCAGKGALHHAAHTGSVLAIHYLLEVCELSPHVRDRNLSTPLHIVCSHGHMEAFEYLLKKERSDLMSRDAQGNTALHVAASNGSGLMCWKLLEQGGLYQLNNVNNDGCTPLDLAKLGAMPKYVDVVNLLSYFQKTSRRRYGFTKPFTGIEPAWYSLLVLPFVLYPLTMLIAHCFFVNKGPVALVGVILLIAFRMTHSHRMNHISRMPSPAHAGMFAAGMLYTIILYYAVILPDALHDLGLTFVVASMIMTGVVLYMYCKLMTTDPGLCNHPRQKSALGQVYTIIDVANDYVQPDEFCIKCEIVRPETAIHCRLCNRCYHRVDHHCLFLYRCVALGNHRLFVWFNLTCLTVMAMFLYASLVYIETFFSSENLLDMSVLSTIFSSFPAVWSLCLFNVLSLAWGTWLIHDQLTAIANQGRSTRSYLWMKGRNQTTLTTKQRISNIVRFLLRGPPAVHCCVHPA